MTTATAQILTEPGVYEIPERLYHADPVPAGSLSVSGAKKLLPPSCPALFKYDRDHGSVPSAAMEFGTAAHTTIFGSGPAVVPVAADNYKTKAAQEAAEEARAAGAIPLLPAQVEAVRAMAAAVRAHPLAGPLLDPQRGGKAEQSLFWVDDLTGVWRRSRLDWLPDHTRPGRMVIADYKTCQKADRASIARAVGNFGYHMQADWYCDGVEQLGLADDPAFLFVFQETSPPYLVNVAEVDYIARRAAREANRVAIERYRDCTESGIWPGYSDDVELISLPPWVLSRPMGEL